MWGETTILDRMYKPSMNPEVRHVDVKIIEEEFMGLVINTRDEVIKNVLMKINIKTLM